MSENQLAEPFTVFKKSWLIDSRVSTGKDIWGWVSTFKDVWGCVSMDKDTRDGWLRI